MGQQIGEASEDFPLRRGAREAVIEADIEDKCFASGVTDGPKITDRVASEKGLRKVPDLTGECEIPEERMGNSERLSELTSPDRVLHQFGEEGVRTVVKPLHVGAG